MTSAGTAAEAGSTSDVVRKSKQNLVFRPDRDAGADKLRSMPGCRPGLAAIFRRPTSLVSMLGLCLLGILLVPATASAAEPCGLNMVWAGEAGEVNASLAPSGFAQWGAESYTDNGGLWVAYVLVGRRTVDKKVQNYQPHGSVNPKDLRSGQLLTFLVYHVDTQGNKSLSRPDAECVLP